MDDRGRLRSRRVPLCSTPHAPLRVPVRQRERPSERRLRPPPRRLQARWRGRPREAPGAAGPPQHLLPLLHSFRPAPGESGARTAAPLPLWLATLAAPGRRGSHRPLRRRQGPGPAGRLPRHESVVRRGLRREQRPALHRGVHFGLRARALRRPPRRAGVGRDLRMRTLLGRLPGPRRSPHPPTPHLRAGRGSRGILGPERLLSGALGTPHPDRPSHPPHRE